MPGALRVLYVVRHLLFSAEYLEPMTCSSFFSLWKEYPKDWHEPDLTDAVISENSYFVDWQACCRNYMVTNAFYALIKIENCSSQKLHFYHKMFHTQGEVFLTHILTCDIFGIVLMAHLREVLRTVGFK